MTSNTPEKPPYTLGLPLLGIICLAALAAPRVVLHDLDLIQEGAFINRLLVFIPPIIWLAAVLLLRVRKPFLCLLAVGVTYGIFLAAIHLLLWNHAFPHGPQLGGNLADMDPFLQGVLMRVFSVISSVITGTAIGAFTGLLAAGLSSFFSTFRRSEGSL